MYRKVTIFQLASTYRWAGTWQILPIPLPNGFYPDQQTTINIVLTVKPVTAEGTDQLCPHRLGTGYFQQQPV